MVGGLQGTLQGGGASTVVTTGGGYFDFDETIRFNNVYNRMICYNTFSWHGAMSTNARDDDRLTLVFFIKGIHAGMYPLSRVSSMPC